MSGPVPTAIGRCGADQPPGAIEITWSDGTRAVYTPRRLRDACPCATCREQRVQPRPADLLPVLTAADVTPLAITTVRPVGQYAYAIGFSDGHSSGIYTLDYLRELA